MNTHGDGGGDGGAADHTLIRATGGHAVCESEQVMHIIIVHWQMLLTPSDNEIAFMMPARLYPDLVNFCMQAGLKISKQMNLMVKGSYQLPIDGACYIPNIVY